MQNKATLYLSHNCPACLAVTDYLFSQAATGPEIVWVNPAIDPNTLAKEYILLATGSRTNQLPGIPALIHGDKILIGAEVLTYLKLNPDVIKSCIS